MYEKSYGSKYVRGGDYRPAADIAKDMRADIKAAQKAGNLPRDLKVSVRISNYSMGRSISMTVPFSEKFWVTCTGTVPGTEFFHDEGVTTGRACPFYKHEQGETHEALSIEGQRVQKVLEEIHWAYNYDGSDIQTDYFDRNYYGQVEMESRESTEWRAREKARQKAKREAAKARGPKPRPNKRALVEHMARDHRRSRNWAQTTRYDLLAAAHAAMHARAVHDIDTSHTHGEGEFYVQATEGVVPMGT